jgi:multimeric flavodoxin WrbA
MMKVVGVLGSPHANGNTALLLDALLKGAQEAGVETDRVDLHGLDLRFCVACGRCYATGGCIHEDDVEVIKGKLAQADGIVLGSPNYMGGVTAQMKTLMDRCALHVHCFLFEGKYGAAVATAGGSGEDEIAAFQNGFLQHCGAQTVGIATARAAGVAALMDQDAALARAEALGKELVTAIRTKRVYPDQAAQHALFAERMKQLVLRMAEKAPFQYEHWEKMGWL